VAEAHAADEKQYRSPVTGLVIKVNVKPGQEIQPNDVIMVLEAMKMETSITAHHAGTAKSVNVAPGDPVKLHQILVELA
jgi:methylmalonyl-CoA carboxyltransferase small subunit